MPRPVVHYTTTSYDIGGDPAVQFVAVALNEDRDPQAPLVETVGFCRLVDLNQGAPILRGVWVEEAWRRRGIGSALVLGAIGYADRLGFPSLSLWVQKDSPARALYERVGFVQVHAYDLPEGYVAMAALLSPNR